MALAQKYRVGILARKHLLAAIEILLSGNEDSIVFKPRIHDRYEIRARRKPHGLELKWAKPGTFYQPKK
jgi:hypothetical protein